MTLEPCSSCREPAGWRCATCGPVCVAHVRRVPKQRMRFSCATCRGKAELLRARRSELHAFKPRLKPALRSTAFGRPLLAIVVCALLMTTSVKLSAIGLVLGMLATLVLGLRYVRTTADGVDYDWPPVSQAADEIGKPLARVLAGLAPVLVVAFVGIYQLSYSPWKISADRSRSLTVAFLTSPGFWLALVVILAWTPVVLLSATIAQTVLEALDPRAVLREVKAKRRDYAWVLAPGAAAAVLAMALRWLLPPGFIGTLLVSLLVVYAVFAACRLLGELLWLNPDVLGWGREDDAYVELGDPRAPEEETPVVVPVAAPTPTLQMNTSLTAQMQAALDARDVKLIMQLYTSNKNADGELPPPLLLRVGQAAASVSDYARALSSLSAAGRDPGPDGGKALVIAARILDERLRDVDGAKRMFTQVVERFPGTQAATYAAQQLADPRFFSFRKN